MNRFEQMEASLAVVFVRLESFHSKNVVLLPPTGYTVSSSQLTEVAVDVTMGGLKQNELYSQ